MSRPTPTIGPRGYFVDDTFLPPAVQAEIRAHLARHAKKGVDQSAVLKAFVHAAQQTMEVGQRASEKDIADDLLSAARAAQALTTALQSLSSDAAMALHAHAVERYSEGLLSDLLSLHGYREDALEVAADIKQVADAAHEARELSRSCKNSVENARRLAWLMADAYRRVTGRPPPKSEWFYEVVLMVAEHLALSVSPTTLWAQVRSLSDQSHDVKPS